MLTQEKGDNNIGSRLQDISTMTVRPDRHRALISLSCVFFFLPEWTTTSLRCSTKKRIREYFRHQWQVPRHAHTLIDGRTDCSSVNTAKRKRNDAVGSLWWNSLTVVFYQAYTVWLDKRQQVSCTPLRKAVVCLRSCSQKFLARSPWHHAHCETRQAMIGRGPSLSRLFAKSLQESTTPLTPDLTQTLRAEWITQRERLNIL